MQVVRTGGVIPRRSFQAMERGSVRRRVEDGEHVGCGLGIAVRLFDSGHLGEVGAGDGVELKREDIFVEAAQGVGELVYGVFACGERAMAAGILGRQFEVAVELFGGFDDHDDGLAGFRVDAAGVWIEGGVCFDELRLIF